MTSPILLVMFLVLLRNVFGNTSIDIQLKDLSSSNTVAPPLTDLLTTLSTLQRKSTCYRTAATSLIHHCTSLNTDIPDPARIQFAIKLTICELDLIQQTPHICRLEAWKPCVRILASRDHWWTTFSGNLREVVNVCWIGRREVEKGIPRRY